MRRPVVHQLLSVRALLVVTSLVASAPIAALMVWRMNADAQERQHRLENNIVRTAASLAETVERELASSLDALAILGRSQRLRSGDIEGFVFAVTSQGKQPRVLWQGLYLLDADGRTAFGNPPPAGTAEASDAARISGIAARADGSRVTAIDVPVEVLGRPGWRLGAVIESAQWQRLLANAVPPAGGFNALFDGRWRFVAHTREAEPGTAREVHPDTRALIGARPVGHARTPMYDGLPAYGAWQRVPLAGWGLWVGVPAEPLEQAEARARAGALGAALLCIALGVALALGVARRLTGALTQLADQGPDAPLPAGGVREVARLRDSLLRAEALREAADRRLHSREQMIDLAERAGHVGFFHYRLRPDRADREGSAVAPFGLPAERIEGPAVDLLAHVHPDDQAALALVLATALRARETMAQAEFRVLLPGAAERWLACRVRLVYGPQGEPREAVGVTTDITERHEAERLTARGAERQQQARREAEARSQAKDEFLAMLSHELRNPLNTIGSAAEVLRLAPPDSDMARDAHEVLARQTRLTARLMDDLLDVARLVSGKLLLVPQPVELGAAVRRLVQTLEFTGAARHHRIELDLDPVWVQADAARIEQVIGNLLDNALKHTPHGARIVVRCGPSPAETADAAAAGDPGVAWLQVRDSGPGIAPDLLPQMFDLFVQGRRPGDRPAGGLGLGLTVVRKLAELHAGTVEASSSGEGSVFTLRLPAIAAPPEAQRPARGAAAAPLKVLIVEDNADAARTLRHLLELEGHTVQVREDGEAGLAALLAEPPDAAIVDLGLPRLDGYELALRARRAGYAGRMLAASGYGQGRDVARALKSGFDAHLVKPVQWDHLRRQLAPDT